MNRKEIKLWAKEKTRSNKGNVWKGVLTVFGASLAFIFIALILFSVLLDLGSSNYYDTITLMDIVVTIGVIVVYVLIIGFSTTNYKYLKAIVQDDVADLYNLRASMGQYLKQGFGILAVTLICLLGFIAFVIPGLILAFGLIMVPYLLANYHEMRIFEAIKTSWKMMQGKKFEYFVLLLSFYGWTLLGAFTLGILYIWLMPYMTLTLNKFYLEIENQYYGIQSESVINQANKEIEEFAELNNLKIDVNGDVYGMFNDYPVVVKFKNDIFITINTIGENRVALDEYFNNLQTLLTNIKTINYSAGIITISSHQTNELHEIYEILNRITLKLRDLRFYSCCELCHEDKPTAFYKKQGKIMNICSDCQNSVNEFKEDVIENTSKGIIGALIGAVIGGVLWAFIGQLGFIVAFVGYLIVFLAVNGYQRMAGCISKKGLIISIVCSVLVIIVAEYLSLGFQVMKMMQFNNIYNAFSMIPYFLSYSEVYMLVLRDLMIGLIFMGVASSQYIIKINKSLDEKNLNRLD